MPGPRPSRQAAGDSDTRRQVIDAAIRCILERGFYRASSNAIAERAGLTWGVIQYYFGSREILMLAVLEEGTRRLVDELSAASLVAPTLTGRIEEYFDILEQYYGDPEYLAFLQVLLNLGHDPRTSAQTIEAITRITHSVNVEVDRLTKQLFSGTAKQHRRLRDITFHMLRGLALSEVMLGSVPFETPPQSFTEQRRMAAEALTVLIQRETGGRLPAS